MVANWIEKGKVNGVFKKIVFVCKINLNTEPEVEQVETHTRALLWFWKRKVSNFVICQPDLSEKFGVTMDISP
jgi:hypothetical protein